MTQRDKQLKDDLALAKLVDGGPESLNSWESGFLESILGRLEKDREPLTPAQRKKLEQIAEDHNV